MNTEQILAELAKLDKLVENRNINKTYMYGGFFEKHRDHFLASIASKAKSVPDETVKRMVDAFLQQTDKVRELQARIDALMFEYCPDEMTEEQIANYATYQKPVDASRGERNEGL